MNFSSEELEKDVVVYRIEEFLDIELKRPAWRAIASTYPSGERFESTDRRVYPLPNATGITVGDERTVEHRREHAVNGVVDEAVTDGRLMDHAMLRIEDVKSAIRAVPIPPFDKLIVQMEHFVLKMSLECLNVRSLPLPTTKLPPSRKEIL